MEDLKNGTQILYDQIDSIEVEKEKRSDQEKREA